MIWATVSSWSCFCWLYRAFPSSAAKNIINLILVLTIWWCPCVESSPDCWKRVLAMTSTFSWQNSVSLWPASFCTPKPKVACYSRCFLTSYFCIPIPYNEKDISLGVLVLKGLVGLHRTVQLQLLQYYCLGQRLGLLWYWMVCLGNEQRSFCCFWDRIQVLHFRLFCWPWLLHFF